MELGAFLQMLYMSNFYQKPPVQIPRKGQKQSALTIHRRLLKRALKGKGSFPKGGNKLPMPNPMWKGHPKYHA